MIKRNLLLMLLVLVSILASQALSGSKKGYLSLKENTPEKMEGKNILIAERQKIIKELIVLADTKDTKELGAPKELAIQLLGEYRAIEAIPVLLKNIQYKPLRLEIELTSAYEYPCVHALANIGISSLDGIVSRLENPVSPKELLLYAIVFRLVDGPEIAKIRLKQGLWKATGQKKKNLERLQEVLNLDCGKYVSP